MSALIPLILCGAVFALLVMVSALLRPGRPLDRWWEARNRRRDHAAWERYHEEKDP